MKRSPDLSTVEPFLRDLGQYQLEGYRRIEEADIQVKESASFGQAVVTEHDVESERRVSRFIEENFPDDSLLGEEHGNVKRNPERYWVLDPIDGTSNFTQGIAYWGPTLALVERGRVAAGWIYLPVIDEMFHAGEGEGAYMNGVRIRSSRATQYTEFTTVATTSLLHKRARLTVPAKHRILGSLVINLAYLASGTFAAVYCRAHIWDVAAGILIAREAGAVVECRPDPFPLDLAELDLRTAPSFTIYGRANETLPSLEGYLLQIEEPGPGPGPGPR